MKYIEAKEKQSLNDLMYSLETIEKKDHIIEDVERLFTHLTELQGGQDYVIELKDTLRLIEMMSYYEGLLAGAKLFKKLNEQFNYER